MYGSVLPSYKVNFGWWNPAGSGVLSISGDSDVAVSRASSLSTNAGAITLGAGIATSSLPRTGALKLCNAGTFRASRRRAHSSNTSLKSLERVEKDDPDVGVGREGR
ncbi:hypothetical protein CsSME_00028323 [Camellia sinensis var. sinensis]